MEATMFRRWLAKSCVLVLFGAAGAAMAADPPRYAVVAAMGDRVDVVAAQEQTGTRLNRNLQASFTVGGNLLDRTVLFAAKQALDYRKPGSKVSLHVVSAPELVEHPYRFYNGSKAVIPDDIGATLRQEGATHLLLVTKYRDAAKLKFANGIGGVGDLEGLGFYVDRMTPTQVGTQSSHGYLAPFVYLRVALIDLQTTDVLAQKWTTASRTMSAPNASENSHPWDVLSNADKVKGLASMAEKEIGRMVSDLLTTP